MQSHDELSSLHSPNELAAMVIAAEKRAEKAEAKLAIYEEPLSEVEPTEHDKQLAEWFHRWMFKSPQLRARFSCMAEAAIVLGEENARLREQLSDEDFSACECGQIRIAGEHSLRLCHGYFRSAYRRERTTRQAAEAALEQERKLGDALADALADEAR